MGMHVKLHGTNISLVNFGCMGAAKNTYFGNV